MSKINCASDGKSPDGSLCIYFKLNTLSCEMEGPCIYQVYAAIDSDEVVKSESVQTPQTIVKQLELLKSGANRIKELWSTEVFQSLTNAMGIVAKYHPGITGYDPRAMEDYEGMQKDIIQLTALNTSIGVALGQSMATQKRLDLWKHQLESEKYQAIRLSYNAGLRRGKMTENRIDMDIKADPEYRSAQSSVLDSEEQVMIFTNYSSAAIELVNALKKRIEAVGLERRFGGSA